LLSGRIKSCGCLRNKPREDLSGKRFGMLTVLSLEDNDHAKGYLWKCRCDCGNEISVKSTLLTSGRRQDCGCMHPNRDKHPLPADLSEKDYRGIYKNPNAKTWLVKYSFNKKLYYLGSRQSIEEAVELRTEAINAGDQFIEWYTSNCIKKKNSD